MKSTYFPKNSYIGTREDREQLIKSYHDLSNPQKQTLRVMAVMYRDCTRTSIVNCLKALGIRYHDNTVLTTKKLSVFLDELDSLGLIENNETYPFCNHMISEIICKELFYEDAFVEIADSQYPLISLGLIAMKSCVVSFFSTSNFSKE